MTHAAPQGSDVQIEVRLNLAEYFRPLIAENPPFCLGLRGRCLYHALEVAQRHVSVIHPRCAHTRSTYNAPLPLTIALSVPPGKKVLFV